MLIAIPIYNEHNYVDNILQTVHRFAKNILVVDDGSTDGTSELLRRYSFIKVLSHKKNEGYGQSMMDIFEFPGSNKFDWVITLDCDYQHEPSCLPHFYKEIAKEDADIISGSRYLKKINLGSINPPKDRVAINREITLILNNNLGINLTDSFCGFKAYKVKKILKLKLTEQGYGFPLQLWINAVRAGLKIREIPVPLIYHDSKRNFAGSLEKPKVRLNYYKEIIQRELGKDAATDPPESENS